jgi:hypothetical protein
LSTIPLSTIPLSTIPLSTIPLSTIPLSTIPLSTIPLSSFLCPHSFVRHSSVHNSSVILLLTEQQRQAVPDLPVAHGVRLGIRDREIVVRFELHDPFEFSRFSVLMHFLACPHL